MQDFAVFTKLMLPKNLKGRLCYCLLLNKSVVFESEFTIYEKCTPFKNLELFLPLLETAVLSKTQRLGELLVAIRLKLISFEGIYVSSP